MSQLEIRERIVSSSVMDVWMLFIWMNLSTSVWWKDLLPATIEVRLFKYAVTTSAASGT